MPRGSTAVPTNPQELQQLINREFGAGVMKFASDPYFEIERLPTGLLALDAKLRGGVARGRHIEIFGTNNVGKTAICYRTIARNQADGLNCSFIDVEGTFDPTFAASQGVDLSKLAITDQHELEHGHRVIDFLETQLRSGIFDIIVLDSIASLLPKAELESSMEDAQVAEQARLMSKALRKLTAANKRTVLMYINQTRESVGGSVFQKRSVTSGGKAMLFYAGMRLELVRTENIKRKSNKVNPSTSKMVKADQIKGHRILVRVEKDKTGSAHNGSETTLVYDYELGGFDPIEDLMYLGVQYGHVKLSGTKWYLAEYPDEKILGRAKFRGHLRRNPLLAEELQEAIEASAYGGSEDEFLDEPDEEDDDE
jgi:recombination protein RecA